MPVKAWGLFSLLLRGRNWHEALAPGLFQHAQ
jgi:hypothetical protein